MAFFNRAFNEPSSFTPLFRLLDDYDTYNTSNPNHHNKTNNHHRGSSIMAKTWTPKFDVQERGEAYELHGEFPGLERENIDIEFTDAQTLSVKGHVERIYESGTKPGSLEAPKPKGAIEESKESHKATVEDEGTEEKPAAAKDGEETSTDVTKAEEKPALAEPKFWISERSVGEFSRSFTFPVRVDQEGVKATMKNGILTVVVPKAKRHESRKITIG